MLTINDDLDRAASRHPDKPAIIDSGRTTTFGEMDRLVGQSAACLAAAGIADGMRVGLGLRDGRDYLISLYALTRLGAITLPVDWNSRAADGARHLDRFGADLLIAGSSFRAPDTIRTIVIDERWHAAVDSAVPQSAAAAAVDPGRPFLILMSSGTTGAPEGRLLTHAQWTARYKNFLTYPGFGADGRFLLVLPLFLAAGALHSLLHLMIGNTVVIHPNLFDAQTLVDLIDHSAATHVLAVPSMVRMLLEHVDDDRPRFPGLRMLSVTGAPLHAEEKTAATRYLTPNLHESYGTAASGLATLLTGADLATHPHSVGRVRPYMTAEIVGDDCRPVAPGTRGLIRLKGPGVATDSALPDGGGSDRDGWHRTGDYGHLDGDGFLYLEGRGADIIIRNGVNIYPQEIEEHLLRHPDVVEVAVFGYDAPVSGEEVAAAVIVRGSPSVAALTGHCRAGLTNYKVPTRIHFVDDMPRTASGKIRKTVLRKRLGAACHAFKRHAGFLA